MEAHYEFYRDFKGEINDHRIQINTGTTEHSLTIEDAKLFLAQLKTSMKSCETAIEKLKDKVPINSQINRKE